MRFGVVVFPGSNCDHDAWYALSHNLGQQAEFLWHDTASVGNVDAVILPGGFSFGDYLRCGALAAKSPVMESLRDAADKGFPILGICNGFQILWELTTQLLRREVERVIAVVELAPSLRTVETASK